MQTRSFDFLLKKRVLLFALVSAAMIFAAFHYDSKFRAWTIASQGPHWEKTSEHTIFSALSKYGDWPQLLGVTALAALIAWKLKNPEWTKILVVALLAATLAGLLATSSRCLTGRTRPDAPAHIKSGWYGPYHDGQPLIGVHSHNSFPSGHTATAVGLAAVILFSRPKWGIPCMLIALSISASRLYLGKHHLSDVIVSLVLGLAVGWCIWQNAFRERDLNH